MDLQKKLGQNTPFFGDEKQRWIAHEIFDLLKFAEENNLFEDNSNFLSAQEKFLLLTYFGSKDTSFKDVSAEYDNSPEYIRTLITRALGLISALSANAITMDANEVTKVSAKQIFTPTLKGLDSYRLKSLQIEHLRYLQEVANKIMSIKDFSEIREYFVSNNLEDILNAYLKKYNLVYEDFSKAKKDFRVRYNSEAAQLPTGKQLILHLEQIIANELTTSTDIEVFTLIKDKLLNNRYSIGKFYREYKALVNFSDFVKSKDPRISNRIGFKELYDYLNKQGIPCLSYISTFGEDDTESKYYFFPASIYNNNNVTSVIESFFNHREG